MPSSKPALLNFFHGPSAPVPLRRAVQASVFHGKVVCEVLGGEFQFCVRSCAV